MTGPSSWVRAVVDHPAGCAPPSTFFAGVTLLPSKSMTPWAPGIMSISRLHSHGSHPRMPTYRRRGCPRRRKACFRPAGLRFGRAGFAPAGRILRISERYRSHPSFQTSLSWSLPWIPRYNAGRPHMPLGPRVPDPPPACRDYQKQSSRYRRGESYAVRANPILGGLHHEYSLAPACA